MGGRGSTSISTGGTVWLTQAQMAELFGVGPQAIAKHIANIIDEDELVSEATTSKMEQVRTEGARQVRRTVSVYNLDMIVWNGLTIAVHTVHRRFFPCEAGS